MIPIIIIINPGFVEIQAITQDLILSDVMRRPRQRAQVKLCDPFLRSVANNSPMALARKLIQIVPAR